MIIVNPDILRHHQTDFAKVCKYAKLMQNGAIFPPIDVHIDEKGEYIVCDGAHRTEAAKLCNMDVEVIVVSDIENPRQNIPSGYKLIK